MVRSQWQAFRSNSELLAGWNYPASRDEKRTDGTSGEEQLWMSDTFPKNKFSKLQKQHLLQAEAKYYCVDELVLGTEQSLGKLGVEVGT